MGRSSIVSLTLIGVLAATGPLSAAGNTSDTTTPGPTQDPAEVAQRHYSRGLKARDKAWKLEEELAAASSDKDVEKLTTRIEKEYERALRAYDSALELDPALYKVLSDKGYALRKLGKYEESLTTYERALKLSPGYTPAIEYRAEAHLGLNRLEDAKQAYMTLFQNDRPLADQLMSAMRAWLEEKKVDAGGVDSSLIEEFETWVNERAEIAQQMALLMGAETGTW